MRTLITGVNSEVGHHLAQHLLTLGHAVVGYDLRQRADLVSGLNFVRGDVRDGAALSKAARDCDTGIHLAICAGDTAVREMLDVNMTGAYSFFAAAREHKFTNAVVVSSAPVHLPENASDNTFPLRTADGGDHVYDLSKAVQELIARDFHIHGTPAMCLRLGHVVWGAREVNLSVPTPLADFAYCRGGWVALEDVVTACAHALQTSPDRDQFEILNIVGASASAKRFDTHRAETRLGFRFVYNFANYE